MKKITLLLAFIACVVFAQAQFLVNETFNYTVGDQLKAHGWVGTGATPSTVNPILITTPTITYAGYPGSGDENEISLMNNGEDLNKSFTAAVTSGTLYYSALINVTAAQSTGDYFFHIGDVPTGTTFFGRIFIKQKIGTSNLAFGILKTSGGTSAQNVAFSDSIYSLNTTYLLVAKVEVSTGNSSLIINPTISSSTEPTSGWLISTLGTTAIPTAGFGTVNLRQGSASTAASLKVDGIKVATSWAALFTGAGTITPSADVLNISLVGKKLSVSNATSNTVEIFNTIGAKVQSSKLVSGSVQLNDLSQGLYIVRVGKQTAKIVL